MLLSFLGLYPLKQTFYPAVVQAATNCDVAGLSPAPTPQEQTLLGLINSYRAEKGLSSLTWSTSLKQASAWMSNDMYVNNRFDHNDSLGRDPGTRLTQCGYVWTSYAENIFPNSADPQVVFNSWKNSPPHNANMVNASYKEAGISAKGNYWTLDLGSSSTTSIVTPTQIPLTVVPTNVVPTTSQSVTPTVSPTSTPVPTPSIILNPTDTKITVSIKLAGIGEGGNKSPKHLTRQVAVGIFNLSNKQVLSGNGHLKYDGKNAFVGVVHLGQLANANYYIKVASVNTLVSTIVPEFQYLSSEKENILPTVTLTHGDLENDNVVDINDYNLALVCFQTNKCADKDIIDFNDDGVANVMDYNMLLSSFKRYEGD